ncbi:MAG: L,D-transpeptidase family protein [Hyphomicrobium sp.]
MLGLRRSALSMVIVLGALSPAAATEPDDRPWDEIDRVVKQAPQGEEAAEPSGADPISDGPTAGAPAVAPPAAPADATAATAAAPAPYVATFPLPIKTVFETTAATFLRGGDEADIAALSQFYDARQGDALWMTKEGLNDAARDLIAEFARAEDWGLKSAAYIYPALPSIPSGYAESVLAELDIRLSLLAMAYARHARGDRIADPTTQLSSYLDRKPNLIDRAKLLSDLAAAASKSAFLVSLHPTHPQFHLLRSKLIEMRTAQPEPQIEVPSGNKISPGKSHPHIALIRKILKVPSPGMKPDGTAADDTYYDQTLAGAVVRFKDKHGIEPSNPTITAAVRKALNGSGPVTAETILANMEQWRWMPDDLGALHIAVNIPEYTVRVIKDGHAIHTERVVTGQTNTQTPIFSDAMRTVVFQPPWVVPDSIKINELLPRLRAGGNPIDGRGLVAKRNGRTVDPWSVDWYTTDIRNYDIQQPPGGSNVLGVVKFLFPNKHAVYLHDTPSKSLFNSTVRTFSHGCVRVRNPVRLAEVLMAEDKGWDAAKVQDLIKFGPENNDVALDRPIPVHLTYFTAWVDEAGDVKSVSDVYGHEQRIKLGLAGRWSEIEKNRDHLLPPENPRVARSSDGWYTDDYYGYYGSGGYGGYGGYYGQRGRPYYYRNGYRYVVPPKKKKSGFFSELFGN